VTELLFWKKTIGLENISIYGFTESRFGGKDSILADLSSLQYTRSQQFEILIDIYKKKKQFKFILNIRRKIQQKILFRVPSFDSISKF